MQLVAERIRDAEDPDAELERMQQTFAFPVEVLPLSARGVPGWIRFHPPRDRIGFDFFDSDGVRTYLAVDDERVLRFGPLPRLRYYGPAGIIGMLVLFVVGSFLLIRLVMRPLVRQTRAVEHAAREVAEGNLGVRLSPKVVRNSPELVRAFNSMTSRLSLLLSSQRDLMQDVSHELRTPLARVRFGLELLEDESASPAERSRIVRMLDEAVSHLDGLVGELLEYTRLADRERALGRHEAFDLVEVVREALDRLTLDEAAGLRVETVLPSEPLTPLVGLRRELGKAVDNLLANASRFARERIRVTVAADSGQAIVTVEDDGPGIPEDKRERILEPFFQLERQSGHTGLGLAIVRRVVDGMRGDVRIDASPELGGARVRLSLPEESAERPESALDAAD